MTIEQIKELALHAAKRTAPSTYTVESVDSALADAFQSMTGSLNDFLRNQYDIFQIISETADIICPARVMEELAPFCETKQVNNGEKVMYKRGPLGRTRAKKFLTQVGLSGVYETFRLDAETFTVATKAIGGAVTMDFDRFIDGAENLSELLEVMTEAQIDAIYAEVQAALMAAKDSMPTRNKVSGAYTATGLQNIVNTVKAYGGSAVIFAAPEFVAAMGPDAIGIASYKAQYATDDIDSIHNIGRITMFRGTPVVEMRQSFLDEKNEKILINPQYAYILPAGKEKVVKIVLEGGTQMWSETNKDQSIEVNSYRKVGVGILTFNNWGLYQNTGINADDWYNLALGIVD